MAVPPFQELMLPALERIGDGADHTSPEVIDYLSQRLNTHR
jgi:hypothetical protein